jgi:plastocyanin
MVMLRWFVAFVLVVVCAGFLVARPIPSSVASDAAHARPNHGDDRDDDGCDNSGPGNCEDRGEDRDDDDDDDDGDEEDVVQVTGEIPAGSLVIDIFDDDVFTPSTLTVDVGQTITFVNHHDDEHTATGSGFDTGEIPPGGTASVTIEEPGTFAFACRFHPDMTGTIGVRGPDGTVPPPTASGPPPADATIVQIVDFAFAPASLEVPVGTTVAWTNDDTAPHTVTAEGGAFDSGVLDPGASFSFTFDQPGTYAYVCALHPNMQGTITVTGDAASLPAEEESSDDEADEGGEAGDGASGPTGPFGVDLLAGSCAEPGETVADLAKAVVPEGDDAATPGEVIPAAVSVTVVDALIADLTGGDRFIAVTDEAGETVACGALGGPVVAGEVVVGLGEVGESGVSGVAVLREERTGTTIAVYLTGGADESAADTATPAVEGEGGAEGESERVAIADFAFDPPSLEVPVGTTVTWSNQDDAPHTATADDGGFDTGRLDQGQSASQTFDEPGSFAYHCEFHPDMTATIVVVDG